MRSDYGVRNRDASARIGNTLGKSSPHPTWRCSARFVSLSRRDHHFRRFAMHPIATFAEGALREHTHPALRLRELVDLVIHRVDRSVDGRRLRAILEAYPDRFRILDPWRGPWRSVLGADGDGALTCDVWVIAVAPPAPPPGGPPVAAKLRETVRWIGRGVDPRSHRDVSRWYAIALAERAVREAVTKRAA
jgi:hypothetical protein